MTYPQGIRFDNSTGARVMDGRRIIPHLIARYDMANYSFAEFDENSGAHPGWIIRSYSFNLPSEIASRPIIVLWSMPTSGAEVYCSGQEVIFRQGSSFTAPVMYVFALDYVTQSSDTWGMRVYGEGGSPLIYDSGNKHLNVNCMMTATVDMATGTKSQEYPIGAVRSFGSPSGSLPASPAIMTPYTDIYRDYGTRFTGYGNWKSVVFYRVRGSVVDTIMLRNEYQYTLDDVSSSNYDHIYKGSGNNLPIMVIDRAIYD